MTEPRLEPIAGLTFEDTAAADTFTAKTGTLTATDPDSGDTVTFSIAHGDDDAEPHIKVLVPRIVERDQNGDFTIVTQEEIRSTHRIEGDFGTLYYNKDSGYYRYEPDEDAINRASADTDEEFTVTATDGGGETATQTFTISITAVDDDVVWSNTEGFTLLSGLSGTGRYPVRIDDIRATDAERGKATNYQLQAADGSGSAASTYNDFAIVKIEATDSTEERYIINYVGSGLDKSTVTFRIVATFGDGSTEHRVVEVTVNSPPFITFPNFRSAPQHTITNTLSTDETWVDLTGTFTATDRDGDAVTFSVPAAGADTTESGFTDSKTGTYGTLFYNSGTGAYKYVPNAVEINKLSAATSTASETFNVAASDGTIGGTGNARSQTLRIQINYGENRAPVLNDITETITNMVSPTEAFADITGDFGATDADGHTLTYTVTGAVALDRTVTADQAEIDAGFTHKVTTGTYGTLYYNDRTGNYKYVAKAGDINALTSDETDTFTVKANDGIVDSTAQTLTINIDYVPPFTNTAPVLPTLNGPTYRDTTAIDDFTDDAPTGETGNFGATDADTDDTITYRVTDAVALDDTDPTDNAEITLGFTHKKTGDYGTLYYSSSTGNYKYVPDNAKINVRGAAADATETFTVIANDGTADSAPQTLTITINGDDIASTATASRFFSTPALPVLPEVASGNFAATDAGETVTYTVAQGATAAVADTSVTLVAAVINPITNAVTTPAVLSTHSIVGTYGTLYYNDETADYRYVPDNTKINLQGVAADATEAFTVTASDGSDPQTLTIAIGDITYWLISAVDEFGTALTESTSWFTFEPHNGRLAGTPARSDEDKVFTVTFSGGGRTYTHVITINDAVAPQFNNFNVDLLENDAPARDVANAITDPVILKLDLTDHIRDAGDRSFEFDFADSVPDSIKALFRITDLGALEYIGTGEDYETVATPLWRFDIIVYDLDTATRIDPVTGLIDRTTALTDTARVTVRLVDVDVPVIRPIINADREAGDPYSGAVAHQYEDTAARDDFENKEGQFTAITDPMPDATLRFSVTNGGRVPVTTDVSGFTHSVVGSYGTLYYNDQTGAYRYVPDNDAMNAAGIATVGTIGAAPRESFLVRATTTGDRTIKEAAVEFIIHIRGADDDIVFLGTDSLTLAENQTGVTVGTVTASDPEGFLALATIRPYELSGAGAAGFSIDANGQITYAGAGLDYETTPTISFTVIATLVDGSKAQQEVTVVVTDVEAPIFNSFSFDHAVAENLNRDDNPLNIGSPITANAGGSAVTYSLKTNPDDWTIHPTLGQIQYQGSGYDHETTPTVTLTVVATANGLTAEQEVTISITDEDEKPTAFALSATSDSVGAGTSAKRKLATIEITDDALGTNTPTVTAGGTHFEIVRETDGSYALYLKAGQTLNDAQSHTATISLSATGSGTGPADQTFTLNVVAAADAPTFAQSTYSFTTAENQVGTTQSPVDIGTVTATGGQGTITYNLIGAPDGFDIGTNGQIQYTGSGLNFETENADGDPTITLTVRAAAGAVSSTRDVTITVTNVNDAPVIVRSALYYNSGKLNAVLDSSDLLTTDDDDDASDLTYTITSLSNAGVLQILGDHDDNAQTDDTWADIALQSTFTQADIEAGKVRYVPTYTFNNGERVDPGETSFTFTVEDGGENGIGPVSGTLNIDFRTDVTITNPDGVNIIDLSRETGARRVDTGTSNDQIITSPFNDQIIGGTGNDDIRLAGGGGEGQTGGADEIFYTFTGGTNWKNHFVDGNVLRGDGGDTITGFTRGEDKIIFRTGQDETTARTLDAFLTQALGADGLADTADDQIRLRYNFDFTNTGTYTGISLQFLGNGASFTGEEYRLKIEFATGLTSTIFDRLVPHSARANPTTGAYIKDIRLLKGLLGEGSLDFQIISPPTFDSSSYSFDIDENIGWNGITPVYIGTPVSATDPENYVVTYTLTQEGASFNIDRLTGQIRYVGNNGLDHEATPSITVTVTAISSSGGRATQAVTITVNDVPEPPEFADLPTDLEIAENLARSADNPETVGSPIQATDPENAGAVTYRFEETQTDWEIDETSGQISYKGAGLDHETTPTVTLKVRATDAGSPALHSTQDVEITVSDEDEDPEFGTVPTNLEIAENRNGAAVRSEVDNSIVVGIAVTGDDFAASDPDDGDTITYRFETTQTNWRIDSATGQIYYIGSGLDHETEETVTLAIVAASTGTSGTEKTDRASVTISVGDEDEAPEFGAAPTLTIEENQAGPHVIGSVSATDEDEGDDVTYRFETAQTVWSIGETSGQISYTGSAFDYDTLDEADRSITLTVVATSGTSGEEQRAEQQVTIRVEDVDEKPIFATAPTNLEIAENQDGSAVRSETDNSIIIGIEVAGGAFSATDEDGDTITYRFRTDQTDWRIDETTRKIYYIGSGLDFETTPTVDLIIIAASTGSRGEEQTAEQTLRITVSDDAPVFNPLPTDLTLNENLAGSPANPEDIGSEVTATYPEHSVTYTLKAGAPTGWQIVEATGQIQYIGPALNYETLTEQTRSISFTVIATANGEEAEQRVTISVEDVDERPEFGTAPAVLTIAENRAAHIIANSEVTATDPDGDAVSYSLQDADGKQPANFALVAGQNGGMQIRYTGSALNYETLATDQRIITLKVVATSTGSSGTEETAQQTVTITITNVDEFAPVFDPVSGTYQITENQDGSTTRIPIGAPIKARDADGDMIAYSLKDEDGDEPDDYEITSTGQIRYKGSGFTYAALAESERSIVLTVVATSGVSGAEKTTEQDVTINLVDMIALNTDVIIDENADGSPPNAPIEVGNPFAGSSNGYTYTLQSSHAGFEIVETTGLIRYTGTGLDFETTPTITLMVTITSNGGSTENRAIAVTVRDVNEAPILVRSNLALHQGETAIVLDPTHLFTTDEAHTDGASELTYTITDLANAGKLQFSADGDTWTDIVRHGRFTQADVDAGKVRYVPTDSQTAIDSEFRFTVEDGGENGVAPVNSRLNIDVRQIVATATPEDSDDIDLDIAGSAGRAKTVNTGNGRDVIKTGTGNDQIAGGLGNDEIRLQNDEGEEDGADTLVYTFSVSERGHWVAYDGADRVTGFKRGEDKIIFQVDAAELPGITSLAQFLAAARGADGVALTRDDQFRVRPRLDYDNDGTESVTGLAFLFADSGNYGGGRMAMGLFEVYFAEPLTPVEFLALAGGLDNIARSLSIIDLTVLPNLLGEGSFEFRFIETTGIAANSEASGRVVENSRRFTATEGQVALENSQIGAAYSLSVQLGSDTAITIDTDGKTITGTYGTLTVNQDGEWQYTIDNGGATDALSGTEEPTEIFTFTYTDNAGETWEHELTITIEGRTDETIKTDFTFLSSTTTDLVVHNENPTSNDGQIIQTGAGNDIVLPGTSGANRNNAETINTRRGDDEIYGGGGNDRINAGEDNDYLNGGTGRDILTGGIGNDIFVLGLTNTQENDLDIVTDFASGDKIEVDTASGDETTLTTLMSAANIRWTQTSNYNTATSSNDANVHDTVIYATQGTASTSDDIVLMVLEDYTTALTITDFEIV